MDVLSTLQEFTSTPNKSLRKPDIILRRSMRMKKAVLSNEKYGFKVPSTYETNILELPNELLLMIFKMLPLEELINTIGSVCTQWKDLLTINWPKILLPKDMPKEMVHNWIKNASGVKHLVITERDDANEVLELVSQNCKQLENIELYHCRGSLASLMVHSVPMCRMITRCSKLYKIHFHKTMFLSCKFFKLLPKNANKEIGKKKYCYNGPINSKQLNAFLATIRHSETNKIFIVRDSPQNSNRYTLEEFDEFVINSMQEEQKSFKACICNDQKVVLKNDHLIY